MAVLRRAYGAAAQEGAASAEAAAAQAASSGRPPTKILVRHFICCAVPMVGFGIMDNTILIRAGDAIDQSLGDSLGITGLECAACGQVLSDFCGVLFGGVIESISRRFILPPALSSSQHALRITQMAGTAGAAIGVVCGCLIGMGNLLFMDLKEQERQKKLAEMQTQFGKVLMAAQQAFNVSSASLFVVDQQKNMLWSFGAVDIDFIIEVPMDDGSLVGWVANNKRKLNIADAYEDKRFNPAFDKKTGKRTRSVLSFPVFSQDDPSNVIAVIQLMNKGGEQNFTHFSLDDQRMAEMVASHTSVFLSDLLEG